MQIDFDRIKIRPIKSKDNILKLDCTEKDWSDPLGVQSYLNTKALDYHKGGVSAIFVVKQHKRVLAFFTLSMSALESTRLGDDDKLANYTPITYPAVLLGQMGVDKGLRGQGLGQLICEFCVGLAATISERVACRYIILQTSHEKVGYYKEKCGFKQAATANPAGKVWMYRRVSPDGLVQS